MVNLDFGSIINNMRGYDYSMQDKIFINIPNAKDVLRGALEYQLKDKLVWLDAYDEVATWLSDNKGKGLVCMGDCGLGKTLICYSIIPALILHFHRKVVNPYSMIEANQNIDKVLKKHLIYLDDIGTEGQSVIFGERRWAFPEIVDEAEKKGKLLIVTTNLNKEELAKRYGDRTLDRLRAITKPIIFKREEGSFR